MNLSTSNPMTEYEELRINHLKKVSEGFREKVNVFVAEALLKLSSSCSNHEKDRAFNAAMKYLSQEMPSLTGIEVDEIIASGDTMKEGESSEADELTRLKNEFQNMKIEFLKKTSQLDSQFQERMKNVEDNVQNMTKESQNSVQDVGSRYVEGAVGGGTSNPTAETSKPLSIKLEQRFELFQSYNDHYIISLAVLPTTKLVVLTVSDKYLRVYNLEGTFLHELTWRPWTYLFYLDEDKVGAVEDDRKFQILKVSNDSVTLEASYPTKNSYKCVTRLSPTTLAAVPRNQKPQPFVDILDMTGEHLQTIYLSVVSDNGLSHPIGEIVSVAALSNKIVVCDSSGLFEVDPSKGKAMTRQLKVPLIKEPYRIAVSSNGSLVVYDRLMKTLSQLDGQFNVVKQLWAGLPTTFEHNDKMGFCIQDDVCILSNYTANRDLLYMKMFNPVVPSHESEETAD